jgi:1-phosphofructokinase
MPSGTAFFIFKGFSEILFALFMETAISYNEQNTFAISGVIMVTCVCLSPCVDKTVSIPGFVYGGMNRIKNARMDPSGKGFNVARVLSRLGVRAAAQGFLYYGNSELIVNAMEKDGVINDCVRAPGSVRTNTKVLDEEKHVVTEFNESNPVIGEEYIGLFEEKLKSAAKTSEFICFSGSLPAQFPADTYERLIKMASACGARCVLDAEGPAFTAGLRAKPYLVKPNKYELELFAGRSLGSLPEILDSARRMTDSGAGNVLVSLGKDGALITDGENAFASAAVSVDVKSTVGAGDSMVGGAVYAFINSLGLEEALKYGVAAAASCVESEGTELAGADMTNIYYNIVDVTKINI